eukprot:CAMPEP_0202729172 /NCGR_PEP_ID=MMETSP1385-20130828/185993_1 /ASSEMBLY_ACC=CAM_ASM_000861 /TAXON_ID=933848 /ORGANISM="Elphidium margaritaceum" /LENGTH=501 /DNA_ID=CAMNT_0049395429 /DNA_START=131 /DNA_END=1636 /DNA_ORIENTATION=+
MKQKADSEQKESEAGKVFAAENISSSIRNARYAVRGAIVAKATEIATAIKSKPNEHGYPFSRVIFCNIGNPQAFCPPPITFHRQVLACVLYPPLMEDKNQLFPKDVCDRAKKLLASTAHTNIGAYTNSQGLKCSRESVAQFLQRRDGFASDADNIFLINGASAGISYCLQCLIAQPTDGILIPIPQYPLYSATITLCKGTPVNYYLDESNDWNADLQSIEQSIVEAKNKGVRVKAIVVINPGNPTGQCMSKQCIDGIIAIARKHRLVILADEVYQENIYHQDAYPFVSFRKCLLSAKDADIVDNVELISFHSVSKGIFGECGLRGGYLELINIAKSGKDMLTKLASINLCPNTIGQCMVELMVNPPTEKDESYAVFKQQYETQLASLQERAKIVTDALNKIDGVSCNTVYGAMYAFPNITIPETVAQNAIKAYQGDVAADFVYCMELLLQYGIVVVAGSGFGQKDGTFHFRTTILPPKDQIASLTQSLAKFHAEFLQKYST